MRDSNPAPASKKPDAETLKVSQSASKTESGASETQRPRPMLRSIGAVLAGLLLVIVLSVGTDAVLHATGIYPQWLEPMTGALFVLATAYRCIYAVVGSYIAARLAPGRPMKHALVLGFIGLALSIVGLLATWNAGQELGPRWYPIALVVTALPCAWVGGRLHAMQLRAR
jgi:hypothetical protein